MLLLSAAALYGVKSGKPILTAASLTLMLLFKGYGIYPLAALLVMKEYRAFLYTIVFTAALLLVSLPVFGFSAWQMYYTEFYSVVSYGTFAGHTAYQTIGSLLMHSFTAVPKVFLYYLTQAVGFTALFFITRRVMKIGKIAALTCAIALNVIFSPAAENYHYILLLPLIYWAGCRIAALPKPKNVLILSFTAFAALLVFPLGYLALNTSPFPVFLLGYPRLYAGAALLVITLYIVSRFPQNKSAESSLH
jgi:hypothetical protein